MRHDLNKLPAVRRKARPAPGQRIRQLDALVGRVRREVDDLGEPTSAAEREREAIDAGEEEAQLLDDPVVGIVDEGVQQGHVRRHAGAGGAGLGPRRFEQRLGLRDDEDDSGLHVDDHAPGSADSNLLVVKVLVVGAGAREHALARALSRDPQVTQVVVAPGNAGTVDVAESVRIDPLDPEAVADLAMSFDLVVVGPEAPLVAGVSDAVRARGIPVFGPSQTAAQIEGSKSFAKRVMAAAGVPTARSDSCDSAEAAAKALADREPPYVVKADGLAAGKGVLVTADLAAAEQFAAEALEHGGSWVVVEDHTDGPEVSLFAVTDGTTVLPMLPAQDHKRLGDGDTGPNTGGMGAYAPLPWLPDGTVEQIQRTVLQPVVDQLRAEGTPFVGLLYAGLFLSSRGLSVCEFNCRFGDPETQALMPLLRTPLAGLLLAAATGTLAGHPPLEWADSSAVTVVLAAEGYPAQPASGDEVVIGPLPEGVTVDHAGTALDGPRVVSNGGRVLSVTAVAPTLNEAREQAYLGVAQVRLRGAFTRSDIAARAARGEISLPTQM